jgi:hypothetical protein
MLPRYVSCVFDVILVYVMRQTKWLTTSAKRRAPSGTLMMFLLGSDLSFLTISKIRNSVMRTLDCMLFIYLLSKT